jgi:predicted phage-related endonuclease
MSPQPINISASRGAAILGVSDWKTPIEIWLEIMEARKPGFCASNGFLIPEQPDNASIRWGLAFEDAIIELAENNYKSKIIDREKFFSIDTITSHIDGCYDYLSGDYNILHEGKTTTIFSFRDRWGEPGSDRIPREYMIQVQHQMICTGAEEAIVSVLVFPRRPEEFEELGLIADENGIKKNNEIYIEKNWARVLNQMGYFHQYEIKENKELQNLMIEKYRYWWEDHIINEREPEIKDYKDIKLLCPEPVGTIISTEQIERWADEYKSINKEIGTSGDLQKRKNQLKTLILEYMKEYNDRGIAIEDDESVEKWILRDRTGKKLFQYNGKVFR